MTTLGPKNNPSSYQIHPKRYFDASPTWSAWNKLSAADVHALRTEPGFEGQQIYFHLNHPIRFVRLVGLLVEVDVVAGKYVLLTLDDGSGACIEVKTVLRVGKEDDAAEYPSNTAVDNVDVHIELNMPAVHVDKARVGIGTVLKVKGTLESFRQARQLKLERVWVVPDTSAELKAWAETAKWRRDVLSTPWTLTRMQREEIDEKLQREELRERERKKKRRAFDAEYAKKKQRKLEKAEARRRREEEKFNAGALVGSSIVPARVTDS